MTVLAFTLARAGFIALGSLLFFALGLVTLRRARLGKYPPGKSSGARAGAWVAFAGGALFLFLAVRELFSG